MVILLDALDEGDPLEEQLGAVNGQKRGVRACANRVFRLLATQLRELPPCVRFLLTTRPDAVGGSVLPALDAVFRNAGGVQHMQLAQLWHGSAGQLAEGGERPAGEVLVLQAVLAGCPAVFPAAAATAARVASSGGLEQLHWAYSRVFEAAACQGAAQQDTSNGPASVLPADVKLLVDVLLAAQEPLPLSLLQALGLDHGLLPQLPGWGCLFYVQEHRMYMLREY